VPISGLAGVEGAVVLEEASDPILTLTDRALVRLMTLTLLATLVVGVGLLGYATWLSLRVRRLAGAAQNALGPRGEIRSGMPGSSAGDELGALARSFAELLERLREHTEYLRTLASKLSHELRTPLAVVTTSLDNLEHEVRLPQAEEYLVRLRQGAERLDGILAAMSEATELEQAIRDTAAQPFDLSAVAASCCAAYRDVYPDREIAYHSDASSAITVGSGELAAQLLDKLVDNAVSFSPAGSRIEVDLTAAASDIVLSVRNRGPLLPAKMRGRIFDSLVSVREGRDGKPHLGLGLHIVALVADFHGGRCEAEDLPDGSGVVFRVWFPRPGAGA
jgi:signal transduction histidine kinase